MTTVAPFSILDGEMELARRDFREWLKYAKVERGEGDTIGIGPYELWPDLEQQVIPALENKRLIGWPKARQVSASTTVGLWDLHGSLYTGNFHTGEFSRNEDDARELIRKQKFTYRHLPDQLQVPLRSMENQLEMVFPQTDSWIRAFPSTRDAGRGYTLHRAHFDEFDFHPYDKDTYYSVKPTLDDTMGQIILTSTINFEKMGESEFQAIIRGAPANGFHIIFLPWNSRPGRDQAWYDATRATYSDPYRFSKEYPTTLQEALAPPKTMTFFDHDILESMRQDCRRPVDEHGSTHIYQKFAPGSRYVAASDTSHGIGIDNSVTAVMNVDTGAVVADIMSAFISNDDFALESIDLLAQYDNPLWGIEDNDWGNYVIKKAQELGYPRLYSSDIKGGRGSRKSLGFHTGGGRSGTRTDLWGELQSDTHSRQIVVFNEEGLNQFFQVIRDPDKYGRADHIRGGHDDYPTAVGICRLIRHQAGRASRIRQRLNEQQFYKGETRPVRRRERTKRW